MLSYLAVILPVAGAVFMFAFKFHAAYRAMFVPAMYLIGVAMVVVSAYAAGIDMAAKAVAASGSVDAEQLGKQVSGLFPFYGTVMTGLGASCFFLSALLWVDALPGVNSSAENKNRGGS